MAEKGEVQWKDLSESEQKGQRCCNLLLSLFTHITHTHTPLSKKWKKIFPKGSSHSAITCSLTWCDPHPSSSALHLSAEPSSASHTPPRSGSSSPTSSLQPSVLQLAQTKTEQALMQPRLLQCHGQLLTATLVLSKTWLERKDSPQHGLGGTHPSTWTCTSRLPAGTSLCTACLPLPAKFSQQNQAPLLFFRHSCCDLDASVNHRGKHRTERAPAAAGAASTGRRAHLSNGSPSTSGMRSSQQGSLLCGVQASLQRNSSEMPFVISVTYGNRMCTLGVFICSTAQVPKQAALLFSPS